jgi:hydroxyacylglutathione hydrolase
MKPGNMQNIEITGIPAFRDNRLWCLSRGGEALVVDPGDAAPVRQHLESQGLTPVALLLTHHHADHVGGVAALRQLYPGIPVFGPAAESITGVSRPLSGGERLSLLGREWRVLALPGHTRGHLGYCLEAAPGGAADCAEPARLFSGDVLFGLGCGRLFEGTPEQMATSLTAIAALPDDTLIYCAHEYTALNLPFAELLLPDNPALRQRAIGIRQAEAKQQSTLPLRLGEEKASNPFLRCDDPVVIAAAERWARQGGLAAAGLATDPVAVFAILREWRNQF